MECCGTSTWLPPRGDKQRHQCTECCGTSTCPHNKRRHRAMRGCKDCKDLVRRAVEEAC
jgi:hypothetical protein